VDGALFNAGPAPGAALLNHRLGEDDYLLDHIGTGFTVLHFSDQNALSEDIANLFAALREFDPQLEILRINVTPYDGSEDGRVLVGTAGNIRAGYDGVDGSLYLVRPDRHVAGRWKSADAGQVIAAMQRVLGGA
ncbi:MAG: monooxygenase, partial [Gammaproteobacteria bacterium]|nr:monooxygenase [Gammaproteobacteria bacterium]